MKQIPTIIAKYLALPDKENFNIFDKFAYLIKSLDGDSYYFLVSLPHDSKVMTEELGLEVYDTITNGFTYDDIFIWYADWMMLK